APEDIRVDEERDAADDGSAAQQLHLARVLGIRPQQQQTEHDGERVENERRKFEFGGAEGKDERDDADDPVGEQPEREHLPGNGRCSGDRSEEHTSELQSRGHLVCRLLLEKKKKKKSKTTRY